MASNMKQVASDKQLLLYIVPYRIQKQRYVDLKAAAKKRNIKCVDNFSSKVTHIVTEYEKRDQVLRSLKLENEDDISGKEVVSMSWFTSCMKAGGFVQVENAHRLKSENKGADEESSDNAAEPLIPEYACQRITCLQHHNENYTKALEILEKHAELRDGDQDYPRALAFRRASCVLKSLSFTVTSMQQIEKIKDIGGHSKKVIREILEDGYCTEVEEIKSSNWFHKMKIFTSVFGIGPSTAKKWIERDWEKISDAQNSSDVSADWRVTWGLAFHEDLVTPVLRCEADALLDMIKRELAIISPGATVQMTGGFRRGKESGHDCDLLITHPEEGREIGLLAKLLKKLESGGWILQGVNEKNSYHDDVLTQDFKLSLRGQLDHFEKWLGIFKFPKSFREKSSSASDELTDSAGDKDNTMKFDAKNVNNQSSTVETFDEDYQPKGKLRRIGSNHPKPLELSKTSRDWLARRVDLIVTPFSQYYYALVGWTGSKQFNRDIRLYSQRVLNMKLTSHGLFSFNSQASLPAASEKEVFDNLKLPCYEPWQRNC